MASGFLIFISFFTRIPIGRKIEYNEEKFKKALSIYTLMGAVIGLLLSLIYLIFNSIHIVFIRGLILVIGYIVITGGIHLDGAADTADGLFSGRTGEKIFDIMSDSHIGAFGVLCLVIIVLSQFVVFSFSDIFTCFMMPVVGRASLIVGAWNKKYAKHTKGMGTAFIESIDTRVLIINLMILTVFSIMSPRRLIIITSAFATLMASYFISGLIEDKIGGMTGDTCGFITEISQIIFMILVLFLKG
ncbi:MAG: adenosylcobinamide-GDP ribazoletransferase [Sedimentibacter sp.]|uniref:adenosylcobinamide-GDP ribazoletransferase n=1 Tax=Sedimentibacter sp. TaxID=1960295 RepID=UPI002980EFCB|nr:adenosylcobinamide-GDP ribazoletransferase [Sedimentibacter sp.]MDW5300277.1 adenosylcobinamide-GDP ribazoletransferase [Sedimentibacter sp.]